MCILAKFKILDNLLIYCLVQVLIFYIFKTKNSSLFNVLLSKILLYTNLLNFSSY